MNSKNPWRSLTTASPDSSGPHLQIGSPAAKSRVKLHRDALAYLLAGKDVPDSLKIEMETRGLYGDHPDDENWSHEDLALWQGHGWGLSLSSYAWSRTVRYHDSGPGENERRASALHAMLSERACPSPYANDGPSTPIHPLFNWNSPTISEVTSNRRSLNFFNHGKIKKSTLDTLLYYGTYQVKECRHLATAGHVRNLLISVGSAIDIHVIAFKIEGLQSGIYLYEPESSTLTLQKPGKLQPEACESLAAQPDPTNAAATIVLVADFDRYQWRYRHERALRNLYIEAGRLMQPLILVSTALQLRTGITPAIRDEPIASLLGLDNPNSQALHTLTIGPTGKE